MEMICWKLCSIKQQDPLEEGMEKVVELRIENELRVLQGSSNSHSKLHLFFDLLFVAFVVIITHNDLPQGTRPSGWIWKPKCLCSGPCPLWISTGRKKLTHPFPSLAIPEDICKIGCCLVTQSCLTLCDPMDWSTPGFPIFHHLLELAQTHVHWVGDAIQPSHPQSSPSPAFNLSQH